MLIVSHNQFLLRFLNKSINEKNEIIPIFD